MLDMNGNHAQMQPLKSDIRYGKTPQLALVAQTKWNAADPIRDRNIPVWLSGQNDQCYRLCRFNLE